MTMVSVLSVVEPHSVGLGGDAFALIYLSHEDRLVGMNASGRAPRAATIDWFHQKGFRRMPERGILSVTVPGALHGWAEAVRRFGRRTLAENLQDAIRYAEEGFPVTEVIAGEWRHMETFLRTQKEASKVYLMGGKAPEPGQVFRNPDLAEALKTLARDGIEGFYGGTIGEAICRSSDDLGGLLSMEDLRAHTTTWVEPVSTDYRGYTVVELPPNGQGITALQMLNILEGEDLSRLGPHHPDYLHLLIEAKKQAFADRDRHIADPRFEDVPVGTLISKDYARRCLQRIDRRRAQHPPAPLFPGSGSETVYVAAVDRQRNACSFISSLFMPFGSGVVAEGTGILLQNRGSAFSLDPSHPNRLEPGKRPLHTIIPGMLFREGGFLMAFGVMGGDMQPQGHVQFLVNLIDFGMNPQEAMDFPRVRHMNGMEVYLEEGIPEETVEELARRGHRILREPTPVNQVGGGQAILWDPARDVLLGASDRRKDGCALGE
jgi:gamma-glutamyltranspeptidase/glutathione hydrolase